MRDRVSEQETTAPSPHRRGPLSGLLGPYGRVLRLPYVRRLVTTSLVARIPIGMYALALILLVRERTGSYAAAGAVSAVFTIASSLAAPFVGRLADRIGHRRVLMPLAVVHTAGLTALALAASARAGTGLLAVLAVLSGALLPPISGSIRSLWSGPLPGDARSRTIGLALETALIDLVFTAGPPLVAVLIFVGSPELAVIVAAAMVLLGTIGYVTTPVGGLAQPQSRPPSQRAPITLPGLRTLVLVLAPQGAAFGVIEVALPAFTAERGSAAAAGLLLTVVAVASLIGGLWFGARAWRSTIVHRFIVLSAIFAAGFALTLLAGTVIEMGAALIVVGATLAPSMACAFLVVDRIAPRGSHVEAYNWLSLATAAGASIGVAAGGLVVEHAGIATALLASVGCATLGLLVIIVRAGTLHEQPA